jgi:hypothetical protein
MEEAVPEILPASLCQVQQLLAQTEQRIALSLEQRISCCLEERLHALEVRLERVEVAGDSSLDLRQCSTQSIGQRLHEVEARLDVMEAQPFYNDHHCAAASSTQQQSCCVRPMQSFMMMSDRESSLPCPRDFRTEAQHLMPHPDTDNVAYTSLSAREVPPLNTPSEEQMNQDACPNNKIQFFNEDGCDSLPAKEYKDLPMDTWGSGMICIIEEVPKILTGTAGYAQFLRTGFVLFCLLINIVLQYLLLWFVLTYVCNPAVTKLQKLYRAYHGACFKEDGAFEWHSWYDFPYRDSLCDMALSEPAFISTMLILWVTRMLGEFRSVIYLVRMIDSVPKVQHPREMVQLYDSGEGGVIHEIVGLTGRVKLVLHLFIIFPKLGINLCLAYIGVRWLSSTVSFSDLILNALALQFIVDIDELLLASLYPERMINALNRAKFASPRRDLTTEEDELDLKKRYHQAIVVIIALAAIVYGYLFFFQQVLPEYVWDVGERECRDVRKERSTPLCPFGQWITNPRDDRTCFPFAVNVSFDMAAKLE